MGSEEGKTIRDRLDRLIKEGERIAGKFKNEADKIKKSIENEEVMFTLLEGFDGVDKAVNELCEKLKDSKENIGRKLDLLENSVFNQCLVVLSRAIGLWYRMGATYFIKENVETTNILLIDLMNSLGFWVGDCIRWSREANPPIKPLHDLLMEVKATFADNLVEALIFESKRRAKSS
ncbi:MAG: hypothetical protein QXR45_12245 [Candidatus Bathyarchaeia archaeon]